MFCASEALNIERFISLVFPTEIYYLAEEPRDENVRSQVYSSATN
jgi:hypothetical protein